MRLTLIFTTLLSLAACGGTPPTTGGEQPRTSVAGAYPTGLDDTCDGENYAVLIGQDATALERILILKEVRVIRPTSIVTQDYKPQRINFRVNADGAISEITCG